MSIYSVIKSPKLILISTLALTAGLTPWQVGATAAYAAEGSQVFRCSAGPTTATAPNWASSVQIDLYGAQGGGGKDGGRGAWVYGVIPVEPSQTLDIITGCLAGNSLDISYSYGWGPGGRDGSARDRGEWGGGASAVFFAGPDVTRNLIAVAGGGGGTGGCAEGTAGGDAGLWAEDGAGAYGGKGGGSRSEPLTHGEPGGGSLGVFTCGGGGGGGGYPNGGSGGRAASGGGYGGGAGDSYANKKFMPKAQLRTAYRSGDGMVVLTWLPKSS
ncbi:glycine-rich protein [Streptomyces erythrochromogenes]|uniref:glycine-rich protein n=1 Tax=Streptomyces erythrochromogenes TaxID=285574 RepID=UPI003694C259